MRGPFSAFDLTLLFSVGETRGSDKSDFLKLKINEHSFDGVAISM